METPTVNRFEILRHLRDLFAYSVDNHSAATEALPLYVKDTARQNDKHPALLEIAVPDEWVKNISGKKNLTDLYLLLHVPREAVEQFQKDKAPVLEKVSPIVAP